MTTIDDLVCELEDFFSFNDCTEGTLADFIDYTEEEDEASVRAAIQKMVEEGGLRPKKGAEDTWERIPPEVPSFILEMAAKLGYEPEWTHHGIENKVSAYENYNGDCLDYDIFLAPLIRERFYGGNPEWIEQALERGRKHGSHVLKFRNIVEYGDNNWVCFLEQDHRCYVQSQGDEDNPHATPEKAFHNLMESLSEEVSLLEKVRQSLTLASSSASS